MLVVAASAAFALILLWRFRPQFSLGERERPVPRKLARQLEQATTPAAKASLLFDAGAQALTAMRYGSAENYFRRALRVEADSATLVERVAEALARRPRGLEALLWRRLSDAKFQGKERAASLAAAVALVRLYDRTPKQRAKAAALRHLLREVDAGSAPPEPASSHDVSP